MEEKVNLLMGQLDIAQKQAINAEARADKSENESMYCFHWFVSLCRWNLKKEVLNLSFLP